MTMNLLQCSSLLAKEAVRHHVDLEQGAIRVVFITRRYVNARGEKLAVVSIEFPDEGCRCRVTLERAFSPGRSAAAACLTLCRLAAETPLVGVEYDAPARSLRIVAEAVIAFELARAAKEKFGGDAVGDFAAAHAHYLSRIPWSPA